MSELKLGKYHPAQYGWRADGFVETEDHRIDVTVREPHNWVEHSGFVVVNANGWTADKNSMRVPAREATRFGHTAVTFNYTNRGKKDVLAKNAQDVADVIDAQPDDLRRMALGLSMGGALVTMALELVKSRVEIADLVAPGKYIHSEFYSKREIAKRFITESLEITAISRSPGCAAGIGISTVANCVRRRLAVVAELGEMVNGTVHDNLTRVKAKPDAPFMRFSYGLDDKLLPAFAQEASIIGLDFDDIYAYPGEHGRAAYDKMLARELFTRNAVVLANSAPLLPIAA